MMEYAKIIAITGLPGLYELVSSKSDGGIVKSLDDKSTRFVSSRVHQFSHLESIEVYTSRHNVNLVTVLKAMEGSTEKLPDDRDAAALKTYFEKVYPELDHSRVYTSDLKKMVKWFAVLQANKVEIKLSEAASTETEPEESLPEQKAEPKPSKKHTPEKVEEKKSEEKKPVKKAAASKNKDEKKSPAGSKPKTAEKKKSK